MPTQDDFTPETPATSAPPGDDFVAEDDFTPEQTTPTLGDRVVGAAKAAAKLPSALVRGVVESALSPIKAGHEFGLASQQGKQIAALRADTSGTPEEQQARKDYADALEGVKKESLKQGAIATGEAAGTYGTLPFGGAIKEGVEGAAAKVLTKGALKSVAGKAAMGAAEGAVFGGAYGAVKGSVSEGMQAAQEGKGAGQIFGSIVHGAAAEGLVNAAGGALVGGVLTGAIAGGAKVLGRETAAQAAARAATAAAAVDAFDKSFHPSFVGERFSADLAQAVKDKVPDSVLAAQIVAKLMNTTPEAADPGIVAVMAKKIAQYREMSAANVIGSNSGLYPEIALPPVAEGVPPVGARLPLSTDLEPTGGVPPQAIGTPLPPDQTPSPFAAGQDVPQAPPEGFEPGLGAPSAMAQQPLTPQGIEPQPETQQLNQPPVLSQPGGVQPGPPSEPQPLEPAPRPMPAPTQPPNAKITEGVPFTEVQPGLPTRQGATTTTQKVAKYHAPGAAEVDEKTAADASFAMQSLGQPTGTPNWNAIGDVVYRTSVADPELHGKGTVELNYIENVGDEKGAGAAVLKKLTKVADDHQVPMTLSALPLPRGNGKGRIPLDKLIEFYKNHGFTIVDEGDGWAEMRREPVPLAKPTPEVVSALKEQGEGVADRINGLTDDRARIAAGNVTEGKPLIPQKATLFTRLDEHLGAIEDAAKQRLMARRIEAALNPEMHAGINPNGTNARDLAIMAAAKMFRLGLRSTQKITDALVAAHGDWVKPLVKKAIEQGKALLLKLVANDRPAVKQITAIKAMFESGKIGKDWYDKTWGWLNEHFGDDAEMAARFISATSLGNTTDANATQMMKAYGQWKLGLPFEGHLNDVHVNALYKAVRGEVFGDGKAQGFLGALTGDPNAVALDRHVMRVLGFKDVGKPTGKSALSNSTYKLYSHIITDLAQEAGVTPRQYQASLWVGKKIADEQVADHTRVATRGGSFRPMEDLLKARLNGLTPSEWVEQNKVNLQGIRNATEGVARARADGGYSFNPTDFSKHDRPGYIVTLDHKVVPVGEASGMKVIEHAKRYRDLTDKYHGTFTGLFQPAGLGENQTEMHMDFNIHLPDHPGNEDFAKKLGLEGRQYQVGHIDANGQYRDIATGYDPATHGPQFAQRKVAEVDAQLQAMGYPTKDDPSSYSKFLPATQSANGKFQFDPEVHQYAIDNPAFALSKYAEVAEQTPEQLKELINSGQFKPMTDAGVAGAVFVGKDGIIHQYIDPVAPSYNTTQVFGSLRGKNMPAMLEKLKGLDILRGHDVVEQYRSQAGFLALTPGKPYEATVQEQAQMFSKMMEKGGAKLASPDMMSESFLGKDHRMNGFWLFPNGRILWLPYITHSAHADMLRLPKMYGYEGTEGSAGAKVQHLLNMGIVRVQASGRAIAFDASAELTPKQRTIILNAAKGRDSWAAQVTDEKGKLVHFFSAENSKPHQFTAALNK